MKEKDKKRFWKAVAKGESCWEWQNCTNNYGYGMFRLDGKNVLASRASWEMEYGPIPRGLCVLHRCDIPSCVNPNHLFIGTRADNTEDAKRKGRLRGGIFSEEHLQHIREGGARRRQLTDEQVQQIKAMEGSQKIIAQQFSISQSMVSALKRGVRYSWITTTG